MLVCSCFRICPRPYSLRSRFWQISVSVLVSESSVSVSASKQNTKSRYGSTAHACVLDPWLATKGRRSFPSSPHESSLYASTTTTISTSDHRTRRRHQLHPPPPNPLPPRAMPPGGRYVPTEADGMSRRVADANVEAGAQTRLRSWRQPPRYELYPSLAPLFFYEPATVPEASNMAKFLAPRLHSHYHIYTKEMCNPQLYPNLTMIH